MARRKQRKDSGQALNASPPHFPMLAESASSRSLVESSSDDLSSCIGEFHAVERMLQQPLLARSDTTFSSLVIRRFRDGVCLQGVIETDDSSPDLTSIVKKFAGVDRVFNQLAVRRSTIELEADNAIQSK